MMTERKRPLIPYSVLSKAAQGDILAMEAVLQYYSGYISTLATRSHFDRYGNVEFYVDEIIRQRVKIKLITKVLDFRID